MRCTWANGTRFYACRPLGDERSLHGRLGQDYKFVFFVPIELNRAPGHCGYSVLLGGFTRTRVKAEAIADAAFAAIAH